MKENDVQPTNSGRPEDDFGQAPNETTESVTPEENNLVTEPSDLENTPDADQDDLKPLDDNTMQQAETSGAASSNYGDIKQTAAASGGNGGKGWMIASIVLAAALIVVLIVNPFGKNNGGKAVATVNNEKITKDELYDELVKAGGEPTLDYLIRMELVNQELDKKSIVITDAQVNEEVESVKKSFPSEEQFNSALTASGMTLDLFKEQTKYQLELTQLLGDKVKVTDEEIKSTYEQYKDSFSTPEQVRASHILVETEEEAKAIIKQLDEGADFAAIAKEKNQDATKETGGDLDFFSRGEYDPAFEEEAFKLEKGTYSKVPVKTSYGYHIVKVTDRKEATNPTLEDKKEDIRKQLVAGKVNDQSGAYLQELKEKAKITNTLEAKENDSADASKESK
ncbi:peptidylprolyl isomerase [Paenibacillus dakarensis]|uniref:peptidylprolyl isomerase n=1 Tax=Paenibacillus dakarensis TaxID=1527293 RepID=UPI0006D56073|nr:peptidyl-prolyl cis-trans isomerase [Paenibacillus dakarensis]